MHASLRLANARFITGAAVSFVMSLCVHAASPTGGDEFLTKFRAVAAKPDAAALADLTRMPFLFDNKAHARDTFISHVVPRLFTPQVRKCLSHAKAQREDGRLVIWCKPYGFYIGVVGEQWRLMEFAADGEP